MTALVSTDALAGKLGSPHLSIIDASWHMPSEKRNAYEEYKTAHIPGAVFFDIDAISDSKSPYPHMLPNADTFADAVAKLGIGNNHEIVVYDSNGLFSTARVWWMFRIFGHDNIKVLNGGLPKWQAEDRPIESGSPSHKAASFKTTFRPELLRSLDQVRANVKEQREQLIDARSKGRFDGSEPEPRPGLASGHITGSVNVHYKECLMPPYNMLKSNAELKVLFAGKNIDYSKPIAASCGSGVTACILALALYELGQTQVAVYDGSWAEWGSEGA